MKRFTLDGRYRELLGAFGLDVSYILFDAGLDRNALDQTKVSMSENEYYAFMDSVGRHIHDPSIPVRIATSSNIESFNAPIYAAYCSEDGISCINRLSDYKRLIGPMEMIVRRNEAVLRVDLAGSPGTTLPQFLVEGEFVFLVHLLRISTGTGIKPLSITMNDPVETGPFEEYMGAKASRDHVDSITFDMKDLALPFTSHNGSVLEYMMPEISNRLRERTREDNLSGEVYRTLMKILPSGRCTIDEVSRETGVGVRTIQRKLSDEGSSFNSILSDVRKDLSEYYIGELKMDSDEVAFILGYREVNSFLRAFRQWFGLTVSEYRKQHNGS